MKYSITLESDDWVRLIGAIEVAESRVSETDQLHLNRIGLAVCEQLKPMAESVRDALDVVSPEPAACQHANVTRFGGTTSTGVKISICNDCHEQIEEDLS